MNCELCGKNVAVFEAEIEGTGMKVCNECARFGKVRGKANVRVIIEDKKKPEQKEPDYIFLPGYGNMVKNARERLGLKQEEMAKKLNERESLLHQIESEHFKPSIDLAKKLERMLHIHIVEEVPENNDDSKANPSKANAQGQRGSQGGQSGTMTLGDMMDKKKGR